MIAAWMVYATLFGALLGVTALAVERTVRAVHLRAVSSRAIWALALGATVLVPVVLCMRRCSCAPVSAPPPERCSRPRSSSGARRSSVAFSP